MSERTAVGARSGILFGALLVGLALAGCTKAHDVDALGGGPRDGGPDEDGGGAGEGNGGNAGSGNAGGSGGRAGSAGGNAGSNGGNGGSTGGSGTGGGRAIFGNTSSCAPCSGSMGMSGSLAACCTAQDQCGLDISPFSGGDPECVQQNAPGVDSTTCPAYNFGGTFELMSCCKQDGFCGVRIMQTAPLGCVDPELLGDLVAPASGGGMMGGGFPFPGGGGNQNDGPVRCNGGSVD